ncbi:MAG: hypothetical protein KH616_17065 [Burkholderia sp.]|nr:hypothetical protein [Burkholderia sp.]
MGTRFARVGALDFVAASKESTVASGNCPAKFCRESAIGVINRFLLAFLAGYNAGDACRHARIA